MERVIPLNVVETEIDGAAVDEQGADGRFKAATHVAVPARLVTGVTNAAIAGVAEWSRGLELRLEEAAGAGGIGATDIRHQCDFLCRVGSPESLPSLVWRPAK